MIHRIEHPSEYLKRDSKEDETTLCLTDPMKSELLRQSEVFLRKFGDLTSASQMHSMDFLMRTIRDRAPTPHLDEFAKKVVDQLCRKSGFVLLKNFPIDLNDEVVKTAYFILGTYLGTPTYNNRDKVVIWPVISKQIESSKNLEGNVRYGNTQSHLTFHTDTSTFAGLLCIKQATSGGENELVSAVRTHNLLLETNPKALEVLYKPFYYDRRGEQLDGDKPYAELPAFATSASGLLKTFWAYLYIYPAYEKYGLGELSKEQHAALDLLFDTVNQIAVNEAVTIRTTPGDLMITNNNLIFHNRRTFSGDRHLYRIWLFSDAYESFPHMFGYNHATSKTGDFGVPKGDLRA